MKDYQPLLFFGTLWLIILLAAMLKIRDLSHEVDELKAKEPIIIYTVDNAGGELVGKVTDKAIIEGVYTVTIGAYGKFIVAQEQFDSIKIGDDAPDYLRQRGR